MNHSKQLGFTLLELSIVIVIIGLIVAGVSAGQSLVYQAQFRQLFSDIEKYKVAHNTFKLQYDQLPGDMSNANSYWSGCGSGATAAECNGDGDGFVGDATTNTSLTENEQLRYWQHLSLAGILEGTFTGTSPSSGSYHADHFRGVNAPAAFKNSCMQMFYRAPGTYDGGHNLSIGVGEGTSSVGGCKGEIFTGREAYNVEQKLGDDLLPREGKVFVGGPCFTGSAYELDTEDLCGLEITIDS